MVNISVIIPNYNRAEVIDSTIKSILQQTLPSNELIVVDDGSTDGSISVIKSFGDRIILIQQPNQGPGAARNAGLRVATGEFVQFIDSDDLISLNKLEIQAKALIQKQADIVYGPWAKAWINNHKIHLENIVLQQKPLPLEHSPLHWFLTSWSMVFQQCLIRRSVLEQVGGYREDMRLYEDGELFVRLLLSGATLIHEAESLTLYRLNDYGKLTASGQQQQYKTANTAKFHHLVVQHLKNYPQFHSILKHPKFHMNVWKALHHLSFDQMLKYGYSDTLVNYYRSNSLMPFRAWLQQKRRGLQHRIQGHRWPSCYQTGQLTSHQRYLIQELGLTLS